MNFTDATPEQLNKTMENAGSVFSFYSNTSAEIRALLLEKVAENIIALGDQLILTAAEETNLAPSRLLTERNRTTSQLTSFAEMLREGSWAEPSIDTAIPGRQPLPKPDIRRMLVPLGPVVVFGASNFPFAYSTAGGDTASALAAGCPVVVKAHQAHAGTSQMVADTITAALKTMNLPEAVFQHVHGSSFETGKILVQHPATAAVGFTGSFSGGKALYDYAHERKTPIPVFSEMGSVNPAVFFPGILKQQTDSLAKSFASSITTGLGQFCTKPGLLFAIEDDATRHFYQLLQRYVKEAMPARMLHRGIYSSYLQNAKKALTHAGLDTDALSTSEENAVPMVATVTGRSFINNHELHEEVFGPFSLLVVCRDQQELKNAWMSLKGQLTTSLNGTDEDFQQHQSFVKEAVQLAGRIVFNGVPTGVEVCTSMVHGGPYPATTDSRFTAVGIHAVKRWVRPVCFQNCPDDLLPDALKNKNPLNIPRLVNNKWTTDPVTA
jgi:NADP-dependent aldehyde dehydrogenase